MDKNSLKKIMKPLIKECLTEILYEQGLNRIIEESIKSKQKEVVREEASYETREAQFMKQTATPKINKLQEAKKALLEKIGKNGFDPFAGSVPLNEDSSGNITESMNPDMALHPGLAGGGVDISGLIGKNKSIWKDVSTALNGKGKKE